jgi:hypothetical protein
MGNNPSQRSIKSSKIKPRDSSSTGNSTEPSETKHDKNRPMKLMERKSKSGGTNAKMPQSKKAATLGSSKSPPPPATKTTEVDVDRRDDSLPRPNFIRDDQVHVNLAMADLMAYLQVVANNSTNLPLTRRDDPELTHMVSNLTSEEYARKSAAFIPADVRVIGGSFLKYGKVWDLPTSEEYTSLDGAQEPGKSLM